MALVGKVQLEIVSADILGFLNICREEIILRDITYHDMLTATIVIRNADLEKLEILAQRYDARIKQTHRYGIYWIAVRLFHRPALIVGILLLLILMCWLPSRILFITVDGNALIPSNYILEQAQQCGIVFGASRRDVRSEKMKNSLLAAIPQLQWAGINTKGCTAVISVKERATENTTSDFQGISSIVAARDGIITSCTVLKGNMLCNAGQVVYKGDVLISAYTDVGSCVKATRAEGEVFAQTLRSNMVCSPLRYLEKGTVIKEEIKYGLLLGKKRINLYKGSGISGMTCDKIYLEYYMTLPGGFCLPFGIFVRRIVSYDTSVAVCETDAAKRLAADVAKQYLLTQMISGKILMDSVSVNSNEETLILIGQYVCLEIIGRVQYEENAHNYG